MPQIAGYISFLELIYTYKKQRRHQVVSPLSVGREMTKEEAERITGYKLAMNMADSMLAQGIISEEEHYKIDQKMCEKYCIKITSIFRNYARKSVDINSV